jgi:hypothetical protein
MIRFCEPAECPQAEALVGEARVFDRVSLADETKWRPEIEGGVLEVDRSPTAKRHVVVWTQRRERGRKKVGRLTAPKVLEGCQYLLVLEVNEAVTTDDQIGTRQLVVDDVERREAAPPAAKALLVERGKLLDHLDAEIVVEVDPEVAKPVEVSAASVDDTADIELSEESR